MYTAIKELSYDSMTFNLPPHFSFKDMCNFIFLCGIQSCNTTKRETKKNSKVLSFTSSAKKI